MAKRVVEETIDDLAKTSPAEERGELRLQGKWYEVDLSAKHARQLRDLSGGRAADEQEQSEHVKEDQVQQPQRHDRSCPAAVGRRSPLVSRMYNVLAPHRLFSGQ